MTYANFFPDGLRKAFENSIKSQKPLRIGGLMDDISNYVDEKLNAQLAIEAQQLLQFKAGDGCSNFHLRAIEK